jgi:hypothetical protein
MPQPKPPQIPTEHEIELVITQGKEPANYYLHSPERLAKLLVEAQAKLARLHEVRGPLDKFWDALETM